MINIPLTIAVATGEQTIYVAAPCRGNVHSVQLVSNINSVATGTIIASRSTTAVNTLTVPTGDSAAGVLTDGTPDTDYKGLVFDPDSSTVVNQVIKLVWDSTIHAGSGVDHILIKFDDSAYVEEEASEA